MSSTQGTSGGNTGDEDAEAANANGLVGQGSSSGGKSNGGSGTQSNSSSNKCVKCLKTTWGQAGVLISLVGLVTTILTLTLLGRENFGGQSCRTDEGCKSQRCDLKVNLCSCTDGDTDYCKDTDLVCGTDKIECGPAPSVAPTCAASVEIGIENKFLADDPIAKSNFGWSVSVDGNAAVIGAWAVDAAYVFEASGSEWKQLVKLEPSDEASTDFGLSVAIDGDTIIVGAQGAAHVYQKNGSGQWDFLTKLEVLDASSQFGRTVALDGDTAIVGSLGDRGNDGTFGPGFAYTFARSGTDWLLQGKLSNGSDGFGKNVALHGDTAMVGYKGGAYLYTRTGLNWVYETKLTPDDPVECSSGCHVAINENTAVIGVIGSAYIFTLTGVEWGKGRALMSIDVNPAKQYENPTSVALDGNTLILGSAGNEPPTAYAYARVDGFQWEEAAVLKAPEQGLFSYEQFGYSVAVSESEGVVLIGAPGLLEKQGSFSALDYSACL
jgi:hypothetical protein